jgi:two-component system nitrate/nitrite response regulator NarL
MSTAQQPIRLLVVDDHNLFRRGLMALLGQDARLQVVGEAGDANQALNMAQRLRPDLILLDNHLPGVQGVDAIADLKQALPGVRILMLTVSENVDDMAAGLRSGADG